MFKKHNALNEIKLFIKRHIIIEAMLLGCLYIVAKNSHIKMPNWMPLSITKLFMSPAENTNAYEWLNLINSICLAFIASIIAYIFIQYIPERRRAYRAFTILKKELCSLYSYMSWLISMYLFEIGVETPESKVSVDDLAEICNIDISDKLRYCRIRYMRNGKYDNTSGSSYNLFADSKKYIGLVKKSIDRIKETRCAEYLDSNIIDIISKIENNWFFQYFSYLKKPDIKTPGYKTVIYNFDKGFYGFIKCHRSLSCYNYDLLTYEFSAMSNGEVELEKEKQLFMTSRTFYKYMGASRASSIAKGISALNPTDERLIKSEGVMLEMLVYYDFSPTKPKEILQSALIVADYIRNNETDELKQKRAFINSMQVKKRLNTISLEEIEQLHSIINDTSMPNEMIVGAAILLEDYDIAVESFDKFPADEKEEFTQWPIYRLWQAPPIEANPDPRVFLAS